MAKEKKVTQYWRQLDKTTIAFYFNVEKAVTDGRGVTHDAGAEVKLSDWIKGQPTEKELYKLQEKYLQMSADETLKIGNCNAKAMIPELYGIQYGFLDEGGAFELVSESYHEDDKKPGPINTTYSTLNKDS